MSYADHTAFKGVTGARSPFGFLQDTLTHIGMERQHQWLLGRSKLADSSCSQPGSLDTDKFTICSFRGEISPWAVGSQFSVGAMSLSFLPSPVSTLLPQFPTKMEPGPLLSAWIAYKIFMCLYLLMVIHYHVLHSILLLSIYPRKVSTYDHIKDV